MYKAIQFSKNSMTSKNWCAGRKPSAVKALQKVNFYDYEIKEFLLNKICRP
jgi:hypothetical protein